MLFAGFPKEQDSFARISGYVEQVLSGLFLLLPIAMA